VAQRYIARCAAFCGISSGPAEAFTRLPQVTHWCPAAGPGRRYRRNAVAPTTGAPALGVCPAFGGACGSVAQSGAAGSDAAVSSICCRFPRAQRGAVTDPAGSPRPVPRPQPSSVRAPPSFPPHKRAWRAAVPPGRAPGPAGKPSRPSSPGQARRAQRRRRWRRRGPGRLLITTGEAAAAAAVERLELAAAKAGVRAGPCRAIPGQVAVLVARAPFSAVRRRSAFRPPRPFRVSYTLIRAVARPGTRLAHLAVVIGVGHGVPPGGQAIPTSGSSELTW